VLALKARAGPAPYRAQALYFIAFVLRGLFTRKEIDMKREIKSRGWNIYGLVLLLIVLGTISISSTMSSASVPTTSVAITNNSSREISHIYLSPTDQESWGADQLEPSTISAGGGTFTLNVSCSTADIKVIAEDVDGCFLYQVVSCGQSSTWTITNESGRNCGS